MKICTITCQNADNHGARLQCFALVWYLSKQGHEVSVIDYQPTYMQSPKSWFWPGISLKAWAKLLLQFPYRRRMERRHKVFDAFSQKYIPLTRTYYSIDELRKDPPIADMYLAGSDQIWNTSFANGTDPGYYLDFGPSSVRRESYAASFAITQIAEDKKEWVKQNLKRFDKITVREQSALTILKDLGIEGSLQEDPVFLLSAKDWDEALSLSDIPIPIHGEKYLLVYDFYLGDDIRKAAQSIAKERNLKIYAICHQELDYADRNFVYSGPETFVALIKHASFVVSNSFHGTVFSMIYNIPFKVVDRPDGLNIRMHDLLERKGYLCNKY